MTRKQLTETQIQRQIMLYLTAQRIYFRRINVHSINRRRNPHTWGVPDLVAMYKGRTIWIECKTPRGFQSKPQEEFEEHCQRHNQIYILARDVKQVERVCRNLKEEFIG